MDRERNVCLKVITFAISEVYSLVCVLHTEQGSVSWRPQYSCGILLCRKQHTPYHSAKKGWVATESQVLTTSYETVAW